MDEENNNEIQEYWENFLGETNDLYWDILLTSDLGIDYIEESIGEIEDGEVKVFELEFPELPPWFTIDPDYWENFEKSVFYFADVTYSENLLELEEFDVYGNPYGPWFNPVAFETPPPYIDWMVPLISHNLARQAIENFKSVYSHYAVDIVSSFVDPRDIFLFSKTLVNLAGFRDHYNKKWMEHYIPTTSAAKELITSEAFQVSSRLKRLFECEDDPFDIISILLSRSYQLLEPVALKTIKTDILRYGYKLVKRAIDVSTSYCVKIRNFDPFEIYKKWMDLAISRDWPKMEQLLTSTGHDPNYGFQGVPRPEPELLFSFLAAKYDLSLSEDDKKRIEFMARISTAESVVHSLSLMPIKNFSMTKFVVLHFGKNLDSGISEYLAEYEKIPQNCLTCCQEIVELRTNHNKGNKFSECYRCNTELVQHRYVYSWGKIEEKYLIKINDQESWDCDYCPKCEIHYIYRYEWNEEFDGPKESDRMDDVVEGEDW